VEALSATLKGIGSKKEKSAMRNRRTRWLLGSALVLGGFWLAAGCYNTPVDTSEFGRGPAPLRMPGPANHDPCDCYEDSLTGGQIFTMYCGYCHSAPALAERPFSQYRNVATHMRVRANLTGKEYAKLLAWLRRWHDVPPPNSEVEPSPKRLVFPQPISELQQQAPPSAPESLPAPRTTNPQPPMKPQ
jgi:hypothetical protein